MLKKNLQDKSLQIFLKISEFCFLILSNYVTIVSPIGFLGSSAGKESTCSAGDLGSIWGWKDLLEEDRATCSSILVWRISWTEDLHGLQFLGLKESDMAE